MASEERYPLLREKATIKRVGHQSAANTTGNTDPSTLQRRKRGTNTTRAAAYRARRWAGRRKREGK